MVIFFVLKAINQKNRSRVDVAPTSEQTMPAVDRRGPPARAQTANLVVATPATPSYMGASFPTPIALEETPKTGDSPSSASDSIPIAVAVEVR